MPLILVVAIIAWFIFGNPQRQVAEWFFRDGPAPWERVDAFYYPDRFDLSKWRVAHDLQSVEACRSFVYEQAASFNDPALMRGDFECGIGKSGMLGDIAIYRLTVR